MVPRRSQALKTARRTTQRDKSAPGRAELIRFQPASASNWRRLRNLTSRLLASAVLWRSERLYFPFQGLRGDDRSRCAHWQATSKTRHRTVKPAGRSDLSAGHKSRLPSQLIAARVPVLPRQDRLRRPRMQRLPVEPQQSALAPSRRVGRRSF